MSLFQGAFAAAAFLSLAVAQPQRGAPSRLAAQDHAMQIAQIIDEAVNPSQLPKGFKGMVVGYLDDFGPAYKSYGIATVDGTCLLYTSDAADE